MFNNYVNENKTSVSIILFISLFTLVQYVKPSFLYNKDGSLRNFGIGSRNKTALPIWFFTLILAILSYMGVLFFLTL